MSYCDTCCHQFSDICGGCESLEGTPVKYKKKIHFDEIKAMGIEELAEFIEQASCPPTTKKIYHECTKNDCVPCWLEWLKQEVSDDS